MDSGLLRSIANAVQKGIWEVKEYKSSTNKATNNALPFIRADNINTNLRDMAALEEGLELKYFKRCSWTGCLLIDRTNHLTITICSKHTLDRVSKRNCRRIPHYLQTILHIQNCNISYVSEQPDLFAYSSGDQFSEVEYRRDYEEIMGDEVSFGDAYVHWVVVYEASYYGVTSISMKKLNPCFQTAQEISLENFLSPDFGDLTMEPSSSNSIKDAHSLVSVKPEFCAIDCDASKQRPVAMSKRLKEEKQG